MFFFRGRLGGIFHLFWGTFGDLIAKIFLHAIEHIIRFKNMKLLLITI
jgi:hypothetical protein